MAPHKLYTNKHNLRNKKIQIAAQYANVALSIVDSDPAKPSKDFVAKFPLGKVPALETADGQLIFESDAIAYYIASQSKDHLVGKTPIDAAHVQQWISFADQELFPGVCALTFPIFGAVAYNENAAKAAKKEVFRALAALNTHLNSSTFLVAERVSLADIVVATTLLPLYEHALDQANRNNYGNVNRWLTTLIHQKQFAAVVGDVKFTDVEKKPNSVAAPKAEGKEKKASEPVAAAAAAASSSSEKKKKKADDDEEIDEAAAAEAKEEKPEKQFELLPKSTMDLDEFKRTYSNEDTATKAVPYFWEHLDKEGYSLWRCDYMYNNELQKVFMSCNLVAGFFQRIEKLRKFAFGSMCVFGVDNDNAISGVWLTRGQDLIFDRSPDWSVDSPSYSWKKLDPENPADRDMVNQFLLWEGKEFTDRKFNQGKIFK